MKGVPPTALFLGITQVAMAAQTEFVVQEAGGHKGGLSVGCFGLRPTGGLIVTFFQTLSTHDQDEPRLGKG
jgi:hypothetical protein